MSDVQYRTDPDVGARTVVLVEGTSDQRALEALAARRGRDLRLAGLCDAREADDFRRGLERAGMGPDPGCRMRQEEMEAVGFFVCVADLEDELIRALGVDTVERVIEAQGEMGAFRTLQKQAAQQERSHAAQLRRFMGTRGGRKIRYARLLVDALDLAAVPRPLERLLAYL